MSVADWANLFEEFASCLWCCRHVVDEAETEFPLGLSWLVHLYQGAFRREYNLSQQIGHASVLLYRSMLDGGWTGFDVGFPVLCSD